MGGRLSVESAPDVGSVFRFTVPFARLADHAAATMALPASGRARASTLAGSPPRAAPGLRILVAEDNPVNRLVTVRLLEKAGHFPVPAEDGREALAVAARGDIDLVLIDVQMPEMDGLAATVAIRRLPNGAGLPIVALTAHVLPGDRERCLAAGMNEYLTKPIEGEALLAAIARMMSKADAAVRDPERSPSTPALEREWLLANIDHDPALLAELVLLYRAETPVLLRDLRAACAEDAGGNVERLAHRLKGSLATLGARQAAAAAARLEAAGHARAVGVYTRLADDLAREMARLDDELLTLAAESGAGERAAAQARDSELTPRH
jgi:CheY-like chemotaxis protein/HPt (histidine-containing phosphotransfer) domain-containing protein